MLNLDTLRTLAESAKQAGQQLVCPPDAILSLIERLVISERKSSNLPAQAGHWQRRAEKAEMKLMLQDPRYWKHRDQGFIAKVSALWRSLVAKECPALEHYTTNDVGENGLPVITCSPCSGSGRINGSIREDAPPCPVCGGSGRSGPMFGDGHKARCPRCFPTSHSEVKTDG